jgi:hypothetical protein
VATDRPRGRAADGDRAALAAALLRLAAYQARREHQDRPGSADRSTPHQTTPQVRGGDADGLACKPGSVPGSLAVPVRRPSIYGCRCRYPPAVYPRTRAGRPRRTRVRGPKAPDFLTLLQVGFAEPTRSPGSLVVSCTTVSPLPLLPEDSRGGLLSVALSRGSPRVGVAHHLAMWSPDFPRHRTARVW